MHTKSSGAEQNNYTGANIPNNSPQGNFGYPHLTFPSNHYDYTPFDALWANTTDDNFYDYNYLHVEDPNPLIGQFLLEETAAHDLYLSNRNIMAEYYTCSGQPVVEKYYADFEARNSVLVGNQGIYEHNAQFNVLPYERQRTSPGDFVIEKDAVVTIRANNANTTSSVTLGPGFSSKHGSIFRAYVFTDPYMCNASARPAMQTSYTRKENEYPEYTKPSISTKRASTFNKDLKNKQKQTAVINLFPNPTNSAVYYNYNGKEKLNYTIKDLSGREIDKGELIEKIDLGKLAKGVYFITIFNNTIIQTDRIILQ